MDEMMANQSSMSMQEAPATKQVLPAETDAMEDDSDQITQMITEHMNSLPKEQQQAIAPYITKDLAVLLGVITGSREIYEYFDSVADPNVVLVPTPKDKVAPAAPSSSQVQAGGEPTPTAPSTPAPAGPMVP